MTKFAMSCFISTVSLVDQSLLNNRSGLTLNATKQSLFTASGYRNDSIGEVDFQNKIGKLCCFQRFVVESSLIENWE